MPAKWYPPWKGSFESMIFLLPRWDVLVFLEGSWKENMFDSSLVTSVIFTFFVGRKIDLHPFDGQMF